MGHTHGPTSFWRLGPTSVKNLTTRLDYHLYLSFSPQDTLVYNSLKDHQEATPVYNLSLLLKVDPHTDHREATDLTVVRLGVITAVLTVVPLEDPQEVHPLHLRPRDHPRLQLVRHQDQVPQQVC